MTCISYTLLYIQYNIRGTSRVEVRVGDIAESAMPPPSLPHQGASGRSDPSSTPQRCPCGTPTDAPPSPPSSRFPPSSCLPFPAACGRSDPSCLSSHRHPLPHTPDPPPPLPPSPSYPHGVCGRSDCSSMPQHWPLLPLSSPLPPLLPPSLPLTQYPPSPCLPPKVHMDAVTLLHVPAHSPRHSH